MSQSEFRFALIHIWYAMFRKTNGRLEVLHCHVNKRTHHRRSLAMTVTSPRKGGPTTYKEFPWKILQEKINALNAAYVARKHHSNAASEPCCPDTGRQCWNQYHITREDYLPSSQSQEEAQGL